VSLVLVIISFDNTSSAELINNEKIKIANNTVDGIVISSNTIIPGGVISLASNQSFVIFEQINVIVEIVVFSHFDLVLNN